MNFIQPYFIKSEDFKFVCLDQFEKNSMLEVTNLQEISQLFCCSIVAFFEQQKNEDFLQNCLGFGFIKDFDFEKKNIEILTPLKMSDLERISVIVKSSEVNFSKNFFLENIDE